MTWCTVEYAWEAAAHVADGAERAGENPADVEVSTLLSCAVGDQADQATRQMWVVIANYAGGFPRYRRLMVEAGFEEEIHSIRAAWRSGDLDEAASLVPDGLIRQMALVGRADDCRRRLDEYRASGITLPMISPRTSGPHAKEQAMSVVRACAPA